MADRLADYFEDLNFDTVAEAGHFIHYERPDLANREIIVNGGAKLVHPGGAKLVHLRYAVRGVGRFLWTHRVNHCTGG